MATMATTNPMPDPVASTVRTGKPRGAANAGARHHARALAVQGLYGWLLNGGDAAAIGTRLLTEEQIAKIDVPYFRELLGGTVAAAEELRGELAGLIDRPIAELSPVEHAVLLLGAYELKHRLEVPYRVAINEAIEVAKRYGGTDGHRYVNGVLDKLAARFRSAELMPPSPASGRGRG